MKSQMHRHKQKSPVCTENMNAPCQIGHPFDPDEPENMEEDASDEPENVEENAPDEPENVGEDHISQV